MGISPKHPCNFFNSWLYVDQGVAQTAMQQQLRFRDQELAKDRNASGEPEAFKQWSIDQVRGLVNQASIAKQIEARQIELNQQLVKKEQLMAQQLAAFQAEADQIRDQLKVLKTLTRKTHS